MSEQSDRQETERAIGELRQQVIALEREVSSIQDAIARDGNIAIEWEQRAIAAVRAGDDAAAREALARQQHHANAAAVLEAELALLRETVESCRAFLTSIASGSDAEG